MQAAANVVNSRRFLVRGDMFLQSSRLAGNSGRSQLGPASAASAMRATRPLRPSCRAVLQLKRHARTPAKRNAIIVAVAGAETSPQELDRTARSGLRHSHDLVGVNIRHGQVMSFCRCQLVYLLALLLAVFQRLYWFRQGRGMLNAVLDNYAQYSALL